MTGLAGLPVFFELAALAGVRESIQSNVCARPGGQGWSDPSAILSLVLLNLAGGSCVDDIDKLAGDSGLSAVLKQVEWAKMPRRARRDAERRWRKTQVRTVPSPSAMRRYLNHFHNAAEEQKREKGTALIPAKLKPLIGLERVNSDLIAFLQARRPATTATLDQDATLVASHKEEALLCYKKFRSYQPFNTWWAEQQVVVHSEFRDGNVPAGFEQLRMLTESLSYLPESVKTVRLRSDTAGYQWDLLRYCEEGRNQRFGRIEFAVGVDITRGFKRAVHQTPGLTWHQLGTSEHEYAEVSFAPSQSCTTTRGEYRYIAVREPVRQMEMFKETQELSLPTLSQSDADGNVQAWTLSAIVTNRIELPAHEVIQWYRNRCGKSEEAHSIMKSDLAGGQLPSKYFGANAAWWATMILALNLVAVMKHLALPSSWMPRRMKAIRYWLINVPGQLVRRARQLVLRLDPKHPSSSLLLELRHRLGVLATGPPG